MLNKIRKIITLANACRDMFILASFLMIAVLVFAGRSQAIESNPSIQGIAPLLLSYNSHRMLHDFSSGMDLSYGGVTKKREAEPYDSRTAGSASHILSSDDQTLVVNLFKIEWEPEKSKQRRMVFGLSALSHDSLGAVAPSDQSLSANFENMVPLADGKSTGILDRIRDTLLMIHFTIKY